MNNDIDFCVSKAMNELHDEFVKEGYIPQWKGCDYDKISYLLDYLSHEKKCVLTFGCLKEKLEIHLLDNGLMTHQGSLEITATRSDENVDKIKRYMRNLVIPILKEQKTNGSI